MKLRQLRSWHRSISYTTKFPIQYKPFKDPVKKKKKKKDEILEEKYLELLNKQDESLVAIQPSAE